MPLANIPVGTLVHNVELQPVRAAKLRARRALSAQVLAKEGDYAQVRLPSGEVRLVRQDCFATIGAGRQSGSQQYQAGQGRA